MGFFASIPLLIVSVTGMFLSIREQIVWLYPTFKTQYKPLFKAIKHIHSGEIIGLTGIGLSILISVCLTSLVISGLVMGWKEIRKRA